MDISIIVPVYNAEKYLVKCLDSLFNQLFTGTFEVIAVDDASTDGSLSILKKYQESEKRLIIIEHQYNKKQAVARVTGMRVAKGEYIMHVDADDWLLPGAFDRLYSKSKEFNPDIILFNYISVFKSGKRNTNKIIKDEILTTDKISVQKYFYGNSATKLVKRRLTENMITGKETINSTGDDLLYCTEILLRARSIYLLPEVFYAANIHDESFTQKTSPALMLQYVMILVPIMRKITLANCAEKELINNILVQFEKNIFNFSLKFWLSNSESIVDADELINSFKTFPEMTENRINAINLAIRKKRYAFYFSYLHLGLKYTLLTVIMSLYNRIKVKAGYK